MKQLQKIAFALEEFAVPSPAQQLLDRFLIGYPRDGSIHRLENCRVVVHLAGGAENAELTRRRKDFELELSADLRQALAGASGVVVVRPGNRVDADQDLLKRVIESVPRETSCFVHGVLSAGLAGAKAIARLAGSRQVALLAGTPLGVTWRLPQPDLPKDTPLKEALVVVQGKPPGAEFDGLEILMPLLERRQGGEAGIRSVELLKGDDLWRAGDEGKWSWALLASAISRSDSPQGDPVKDGRTQDLVGLGLVPKLAREPRGWLIEHRDGLRSAILVLDGVIADYDFAVRDAAGTTVSAQIYRPPAPADHQFSRLAEVIEEFFRSGIGLWPLERGVLVAGLLELFGSPLTQSGKTLETPQLDIAYRV
ncbi:MAG: hypothetical protein HY735_28150 [Verrucomicrobia bacterium]|nr:hypothetical protein [Verrucomicrobiota bacterium]